MYNKNIASPQEHSYQAENRRYNSSAKIETDNFANIYTR